MVTGVLVCQLSNPVCLETAF